MRFARDERKTRSDSSDKNKKPDMRAQVGMLEGMLLEKDGGALNIKNLLHISRHFSTEDAGKKARGMILEVGKEPSTRDYVVGELMGRLPYEPEAARLLGKLKANEAIEVLRDMARIDNMFMTEKVDAAIWALGELKTKRGIPECIAGLSDPGLMSTPSKALLKIGKASIPALIEALSDKSDNIKRKGAAETLGQFGSDAKEALPILEKLSNPWTIKGFWARITDKNVYDAAGHAVFQIEHSASFE